MFICLSDKMAIILQVLTTLTLLEVIVASNNICFKDDKCNCYRVPEYEFQCPPDNFEVILHAMPNKYLKIDCYNLTEYNVDIFPDFNAGEIDYFMMSFCPLPRNDFVQTMQHFNVTKLKKLYLDECYLNGKVNMTLFNGLESLQVISLSRISQTFDVETFNSLPNLTQLYLDTNNITDIGFMFTNNTKLKVLHLSRNLIKHIPEFLFSNLTELQQLHLWSNAITNITKHTFFGLTNLKSLELSTNQIELIEPESFQELINLVNISLRSNKLKNVDSNLFKYNLKLEGVRIGDNPDLILPEALFGNLPKLTNVNMANCRLKELPELTFTNSKSLTTLILSNNELETLNENVFESQIYLKKLDLSKNKMRNLPDKIFSALSNLEELNLEQNMIVTITSELFTNTQKLKILNLNRNAISVIDNNAFNMQTELVNLDLSHNQYNMTMNFGQNYIAPVNPFTHCQKLQQLNLRHNNVKYFTDILLTHLELRKIDMAFNKIQFIEVSDLRNLARHKVYIDLSDNQITHLDFRSIKLSTQAEQINYDNLHNNSTPSVVNLQNNPLSCDCFNFDFVQFMHGTMEPLGVKTLIDLNITDQCNSPESLKHFPISKVFEKIILCPYTGPYVDKCEMYTRPLDGAVIANCSHRNLTDYPVLNLTDARVELNLKGNLLEEGPNNKLGYDNVKVLFLNDNKIRSVDWIPPAIEFLALDNNELTGFKSEVLQALNKSKTLKTLSLSANRWSCGCSALELQNFLNDNYNKVMRNEVVCKDDNIPLIQKKEICKSTISVFIKIIIPILAFLLLSAVAIALYFKFKQEIKVWLYAKNLCLWFVTEEELDKDKLYDVFISYSHKDEDFVVQNLLPVLESGPNPFKVCIHVRDFIPGEFIATQVTESVYNSRRTLVVLSDNFLESIWGKLEFRIAHTRAIEEGRARVIVVKYGELNEEKLDDDLKSYLKTNTYVEWGKPWFWNKLKYALPHTRQNNFYHTNQRHASVMLKIDDKFELTAKPEVLPESTPPVLLDASLLKNHPLHFNGIKGTQQPLNELPLINR